MPYDDHVRTLLTSRSARTGPLASFYSPVHPAAETFSMQSPHPRESPSLSNWSESPSCYSQSRMSVDDSASETSTTSGYYGQEIHRDSDLYMSSVLQRHHGSSAALGSTDALSEVNTVYRDSYVDPLRDSSEDERTEGGAIASGSNDTLSDTCALRPVESDTSVSTGLSDPSPDPRLSFLGPKTRMISKAPWEEDTIQEEALSDTETQTDTLSIFAGKLKVKGRSRSKTVTSEKTGKERRFLGGGWGRSSTDTRPSMDSFKRSMDVPISPRSGSFVDQVKVTARTPSLFSTSSGASSGPSGTLPGARQGLGTKLSSGLSVNSFSMDSRATSPVPSGSPTTSSFIHPYANLELLPPGHETGAALPPRSDSDTTLTASTGVSPHMTPSSSTSPSTSPSDETFGSKKEKRRPPQISVSPLNRSFGGIATSVKSPTALSTNFSLVSPTLQISPTKDDTPAGMLGFPGSPACNLISLEQAQMKARERSKSTTSDTVHASPLRKELKSKKSKPTLAGIGGGFSSTIGVASPSSVWIPEDGRARTVSAGSALHGRSKGYTGTSALAAQSTTSVNIIQGGGIENIPEAAASKSSGLSGSTTDSAGTSATAAADTTPSRTLKPKRSGFLKFFKDMTSSSSNSGNPNISAPSTPIHVAHTSIEPLPPVPKVPVQFQSKSSTLPDEGLLRDKAPPPVVVSSPDPRSLERSQSLSDDSHTSIGDHASVHTPGKFSRSNTEPVKRSDNAGAQGEPFGSLKLRPVSSTFNGLPGDYLVSSPQIGSGARGSSEAKTSGDYGFQEANIFSPATPSFPASARSRFTHGSSPSTGSDAFSSLVDPRTPSSLGGFPPGVPRTSTDSQSSAAVIALLREQLRAVRQASKIRVNELESQVQELKLELEKTRCDQCGRRVSEERRSTDTGIVNRPRARTGGGSRTLFGAQE
ncbi:hypothetical protein FS749_015637 [Ceratobasidium sp. UAMH 11750]|nr:hypothetical protein FS749_015637 [Ceratobasidium sp. UAMH 11750]